MATKDFGPIEGDYAFFMAHATEAERDAAAYELELAGFATGRSGIRLLDVGCGAGDFMQRLLAALRWPPEALSLTLVEPVARQRQDAASKVAEFTRHPVDAYERLPQAGSPSFDVILSNHALYYVDDLAATLRQMLALLRPGGKMLLAIAGWDNALMRLWQGGFKLLNRSVPYYAADDVAAALFQQGCRFRRSQVDYQLCFPDAEENRLKVLRFLFGEHLAQMPLPRLLIEFDRYIKDGRIEISTRCDHLVVE